MGGPVVGLVLQASLRDAALRAARSAASGLGLPVDDAVVLHDSNRLAVRLVPCDVVARVVPATTSCRRIAEFEVEMARRLVAADGPVAALEPRFDPRVYERDDFVINFWAYHQPVSGDTGPTEYAETLMRLHGAMRGIDHPAPHFTDRVAEAQRLVADPDRTPELEGPDRRLLGDSLARLRWSVGRRGGREQLLHGEPHPGNLLRTERGLLFVDLETLCRGPVEFDIAHCPEEVADHYPDADRQTVRLCRVLMRAMVTTWRWDRDDDFPDRDRWRHEGLRQLRAELESYEVEGSS